MVKKMTKEDSLLKLKELNFQLIDESLYINTNTRLNIKCLTHNIIWESTIGEAYRLAKYCKQCKLKNNKNWKDIANEKEYNIINEYGNGYAIFKCKNNHEWRAQKNHIKFTFCKECNGKISEEMVLEKMKLLNINIKYDKYKNTHTRGYFKCKYSHEWNTEIYNVYSEKSGCPICNINLNENRCKFILETIFNKLFDKTRKIIDNGLELDMYNEELKLALEYNGIQHYQEHKKHFHKNGGFIEQLQRDEYKIKFCKENNINLIIVDYTKNSLITIKDYILEQLQILNYTYLDPDKINWKKIYSDFTKANNRSNIQFNKILDIMNQKNAICLETSYLGYEELHRFKCANNHLIEISPRNLFSKKWCKYCAHNAPVTFENIKSFLINAGFEILSTEYIKCSLPLLIKCIKCNKEFKSSWDNIKQRYLKRGCTFCNKKINIK